MAKQPNWDRLERERRRADEELFASGEIREPEEECDSDDDRWFYEWWGDQED